MSERWRTLRRKMGRGTWLLAAGVALLAVVPALAAGRVFQVVQHGRAFDLKQIEIAVGDTLHFNNNDEFIHQIYVKSDSFNFESDEQPPGEAVEVKFTQAGTFAVQCEIHPKMHLSVTVK